MKVIISFFKLIAVGLTTAIFLYPIVHEVGHAFFGVLSGTKIVEFNLFPVPYVSCEIEQGNIIKYVMTGMGGLVTPFLITELYVPKNFWFWYTWISLKVITIIALIYSLVLICLYDGLFKSDDIIKVLKAIPNYELLLIMILIGMITVSLIRVYKSNPKKRIIETLAK